MRSHKVILHKPDLYKTNDGTFHILLFLVFSFNSLLRELVMSSELVNIGEGLLAVYGRVKCVMFLSFVQCHSQQQCYRLEIHKRLNAIALLAHYSVVCIMPKVSNKSGINQTTIAAF